MQQPVKPRALGDIVPRRARKGRWDAFSASVPRLNLSLRKRNVKIPLTKFMRPAIIVAAVAFFVFGSALAPTIFMHASGDTTTSTASSNAAEQSQLESQLQQLEAQINQYQGQISSYEKQGNTLSSQISTLNAKIASINLQIRATNLTLSELDDNIAQTQSQITVTQSDIVDKKAALGDLLQELYKNDQVSLIEAFLKDPQLSDFWNDTQNITLLQDNLRVGVVQVTDLQGQLQDQEQQFEASKQDTMSIAQYQAAQASEVASTKSQENQLLSETKGQESKYKVLLTQTQATAAQIRNRIFQLLGGGQLTFESAYQYAKTASGATGVDPSLILAVLDRESALGQNVGQCSYKTAMSPSNIPIFLQITQQLGLDPNTMMVSCANADGAYGGAMGPAQFVPSTWELYASGVSKITGDDPPSPWKNADAFVATALYLEDAMTGCKANYTAALSIERCTAAKYYAGSRWANYLWTYGEAVVERAQSFAQDISTITS
jgi:peptidoglycan hydrolase CwlO-like protein